MAIELTTGQAREIAGLRRRWPHAAVRAHQRAWGVIVEVRDARRTLALVGLDGSGGVHRDRPIPRAGRLVARPGGSRTAAASARRLPEAA